MEKDTKNEARRQAIEEGEMPISGHLQEFRKRLIICLATVAAASVIAYQFVDDIIAMISAPAGKLYFLNPTEVFFSYLEIAVCTGALVTLPILCYEIWQFVRPALAPTERHAVLWLVPFAVLLFYAGLAFSFFLVLPAAVQFFMGFSTDTLQPMFSLSAYLSFFIAFISF